MQSAGDNDECCCCQISAQMTHRSVFFFIFTPAWLIMRENQCGLTCGNIHQVFIWHNLRLWPWLQHLLFNIRLCTLFLLVFYNQTFCMVGIFIWYFIGQTACYKKGFYLLENNIKNGQFRKSFKIPWKMM